MGICFACSHHALLFGAVPLADGYGPLGHAVLIEGSGFVAHGPTPPRQCDRRWYPDVRIEAYVSPKRGSPTISPSGGGGGPDVQSIGSSSNGQCHPHGVTSTGCHAEPRSREKSPDALGLPQGTNRAPVASRSASWFTHFREQSCKPQPPPVSRRGRRRCERLDAVKRTRRPVNVTRLQP